MMKIFGPGQSFFLGLGRGGRCISVLDSRSGRYTPLEDINQLGGVLSGSFGQRVHSKELREWREEGVS